MQILLILFYIVQAIVAFWLLQPIILVIICYIKKGLGIKAKPILDTPITKEYDFAAIVTAHQDTRFIKPLVNSLLQQTHKKIGIYVVADDCDITDISFTDERVIMLRPEVPFHSKIKSIQHALESFVRKHDNMVIFDSDNLVHPQYFEIVNAAHNKGYRAVQGNIVAKNLDSIYARMDEAGQIVKTFHDKLSRQELGFSSTIFGLGLSIFVDDYNNIAYEKGITGGFDKKLQAAIVKKARPIAFLKEAIIYDEKIPDGQQLQKQRTRWIHAHFKNMNLGVDVMVEGFKKFSFDLIYYGFVLLIPPVFLVMLSVFLMMLINLFVNPIMVIYWILGLVSFALSFPLVLKFSGASKTVMKAAYTLPVFMYWQIMALLGLSKAKKDFLKTEHHAVLSVEEVMKLHKELK